MTPVVAALHYVPLLFTVTHLHVGIYSAPFRMPFTYFGTFTVDLQFDLFEPYIEQFDTNWVSRLVVIAGGQYMLVNHHTLDLCILGHSGYSFPCWLRYGAFGPVGWRSGPYDLTHVSHPPRFVDSRFPCAPRLSTFDCIFTSGFWMSDCRLRSRAHDSQLPLVRLIDSLFLTGDAFT